MLYIVIVVRDVDAPCIVEIAGIFDTIKKAQKAKEKVEEWLKDEGANYDIYILEHTRINHLSWRDDLEEDM